MMGKFNFKNGADFEAVREKAEAFYVTIGAVHCPYFQSKVAFNSKGIRHLKFKSDEVARSREDQYSRLKLVHIAPEVLKLSKTVQGIWNTQILKCRKPIVGGRET